MLSNMIHFFLLERMCYDQGSMHIVYACITYCRICWIPYIMTTNITEYQNNKVFTWRHRFYVIWETVALGGPIYNVERKHSMLIENGLRKIFSLLSELVFSVIQVDFILYDTESTRLIDFVIGQFWFQLCRYISIMFTFVFMGTRMTSGGCNNHKLLAPNS